MVVEIDTAKDTTADIAEKLRTMQQLAEKEATSKRKSIAHLSGSVKWDEDALAYQKRLRNEWE